MRGNDDFIKDFLHFEPKKIKDVSLNQEMSCTIFSYESRYLTKNNLNRLEDTTTLRTILLDKYLIRLVSIKVTPWSDRVQKVKCPFKKTETGGEQDTLQDKISNFK